MTSRNNFIGLLFFLSLLSIFSGCQILKNLDILSSDQRGIYHTVQEGQTLYFIARAYDVDVNRLRRINGVYDPTQLQVGTRLWIPGVRQVLEIDLTKNKHFVAPKKGGLKKKIKDKKFTTQSCQSNKRVFNLASKRTVNV